MSRPPGRIYVSGAARRRRVLRLFGLGLVVVLVIATALALLWL